MFYIVRLYVSFEHFLWVGGGNLPRILLLPTSESYEPDGLGSKTERCPPGVASGQKILFDLVCQCKHTLQVVDETQ